MGETKGAQPLVSVVMTAYNGVTYLHETIRSILRQTCTDFEFIIVDDCSTDATAALIQSYNDTRILFVRNEVNLGISESRNKALRMARGHFIATTDQDDVSEPERLAIQVRYLQANPSISVLASRVYYLMGDVRMGDPMPVQSSPLAIRFALFFGRHNTTYSSLCLSRQHLLDNDLFFRKRFHYAEDFELFSRLVQVGDMAILPQPLVGYRLHDSNNSKLHSREMSVNGMTFMKDCYASELGRPVDEAEGWRIWSGLIDKHPQDSVNQLRELGRLTTELTARFLDRHAKSELERQTVRLLAAEIWHDIVDRSVRGLGWGAERVRREFPDLQAWTPSTLAMLRTNARALIGRWRAGRVNPT